MSARLGYETLKNGGYTGFLLKEAPIKVLQFGEGNFLRAFVDYFFDMANETAGFNGKVAVVQPIANGLASVLNEQDGLYTLYSRGLLGGETVNEKRVISAVGLALNPYENFDGFLALAREKELRFIVSNTTESGIAFDVACKFDDAPPSSFPAKLTRLLFERYTAGLCGLIILPCELIDDNGAFLREYALKYAELWKLGDEFISWVKNENYFCSTLVDRIVTGYPKTEAASDKYAANGYDDALLDVGEPFALWVIEAPETIRGEFPFEKAGLPVVLTDDHKPYKRRKVRVLNGAHTALTPVALLCGVETVGDCMKNALLRRYTERVLFGEVMPTLTDLDEEDVKRFAGDVLDRFSNPFIEHKLTSIALNTTSKWRARVMPTVKDHLRILGKLPPLMTFSFAATLKMVERFDITDSDDIRELWGELKRDIDGFGEGVELCAAAIEAVGCEAALRGLMGE